VTVRGVAACAGSAIREKTMADAAISFLFMKQV
jgi:hypothetical protein